MNWPTNPNRLTCNRIFRHLIVYGQREFTGCLEVSCPGSQARWRLYLCRGRLAWAMGGEHPRRRWYRQLCLATGRKPRIPDITATSQPCWDYWELCRLSQDVLQPEQVRAILQGIIAEVLFDLVQVFEQPLIARTNGYGSLMDISVLVGVGDGLCVTARADKLLSDRPLPSSWYPTVGALRQQVQATWEDWVELGLASRSPNLAPAIRDAVGLQRETTPKAYENLARLLDGTRTLRDVSLRFRDNKDLLKAARGLAPYIHRGLIALDRVGDYLEAPQTVSTLSSEEPSLVCVARERHTLDQVEFLAVEAGYDFIGFPHAFEALYKFEQQQLAAPTLMFVALDSLTLSGEEFCTLLRRLPALRSVPTVLHSRQPIPRLRRQELVALGATEFLWGDVFDASLLWQRLVLLRAQTIPPTGDREPSRRAIGRVLETIDAEAPTLHSIPAPHQD